MSEGFIKPWIRTLGVLAGHGDRLFRRGPSRLLRRILRIPALHRRFERTGGAQIMKVLRLTSRFPFAEHPWTDLWQAMSVQHPTRDAWWDERDLTPLLADVSIPVYLGSEWSNVPLHSPGVFAAWDALAGNPNVRLSLLGENGLPWPWESMHIEALAWYDQWLKGRDTGILDGPRVRYWLPGAEQWRTSDQWPPAATYRELALNPDGRLDPVETAGERRYACPGVAGQPDHLTWTSGPLDADLDVVGHLELQLTATTTASDTGWISLLEDVAPDGTATAVTQGWLRASLREVDEQASRPGRPVLPLRTAEPVPVGEPVRYRIPLVANGRRFARGHRIRLTLASDDTRGALRPMLGFTHTPVGLPTVNTVSSSSRLLLPVVPSS